MSLFSAITRLFASSDRPRDPSDERWWGGAAFSTDAGVTVSMPAVRTLGAAQSVASGISGAISGLPFRVITTDSSGYHVPATDHPLDTILNRRPTDMRPRQEVISQIVIDLVYNRNALCRLIPADDGHPVGGIEPIDWSRVTDIKREGNRVTYQVAPALGTIGRVEYLTSDDVWHIRMAPLTADGLRGQTMLETSADVFGRALAVRRFGDRFFKNDGQRGGIIEGMNAAETKEKTREFLNWWRAQSTGANQHRDRLLLGGMKYNPGVPAKNNEAQFLETMAAQDAEIFGLWSFPPHRAARLERSTNNNIEHQGVEFVVYCLGPFLDAIQQSASLHLLVGPDRDRYFCEFNVDGLLRGAITERYKAFALGRQWGWLSVNDILRMLNKPGIGPKGDRYLEPVNMTGAGETNQGNP